MYGECKITLFFPQEHLKYGGKDGEEMWQKCRIDKNVD